MRHIEINQKLYKSTKNELTGSEHGTDETKFSLYRGAKVTTPEAEIDLATLHHWITRSDKVRQKINAVRNSETDDARKAAKALLPAVSVAGIFSQRNDQALIQYAGLIVLDFDDVPQPEQARDILARCAGCVLAFVSPSGTGVKAIFRHDGQPEHHAHTFRQIAGAVERLTGLTADKSGKDLSRLCYLSHDPDARFNPDAAPFAVTPPDKPSASEADDPPAQPGVTDERIDEARARFMIADYLLYKGFAVGNRMATITGVIGLLNTRGVARRVAENALRLELTHHVEGGRRDGGAWVEAKTGHLIAMYGRYANEHGANAAVTWSRPQTGTDRTLTVWRYIGTDKTTGGNPELDAFFDDPRHNISVLTAPTDAGKTTYLTKRLLRLTNGVNILAVPNTTKAAQLAVDYPALFAAYGDSGWRRTWRENGSLEIQAGGAVVFVCTYDQVPDVVVAIGQVGGVIDTLVVDELHELPAGEGYRTKAMDGLMKTAQAAKRVIFVTATPPMYTRDFMADVFGDGVVSYVQVQQQIKKKINVKVSRFVDLDLCAADILDAVLSGRRAWVRVNNCRKIDIIRNKLTSHKWARAQGFTGALGSHEVAALTGGTKHEGETARQIIQQGTAPHYVRVVLVTQLLDSGININDETAAPFWVDVHKRHAPPTPETFAQFAARFRKLPVIEVRAYFDNVAGTFKDGSSKPRGWKYEPDVNFYHRERERNRHLNDRATARKLKQNLHEDEDAIDLRNGVKNDAAGRFDATGNTRPLAAWRLGTERQAQGLNQNEWQAAVTALNESITFEDVETDWEPTVDAFGCPLPDIHEAAAKALQKHGAAALYDLLAVADNAQAVADFALHQMRWNGKWRRGYTHRFPPPGLTEHITEIVEYLRRLLAGLPEVIEAEAVDVVMGMTNAEILTVCKLKLILDRLGYLRTQFGCSHPVALEIEHA